MPEGFAYSTALLDHQGYYNTGGKVIKLSVAVYFHSDINEL